MATFVHFSPSDLSTIQDDFKAAERRCMRCLNSLTLSPRLSRPPGGGDPVMDLVLRSETVTLLKEAFGTDGGDEGLLDTIKNVFTTFSGRASRLAVSFVPKSSAPNKWDFDAYTKPSEANSLYVRDGYFRKSSGKSTVANPQSDRVLTLIHEHVHLIFSRNPGDGHPGGQFLYFGRTTLGAAASDAVKNPYCYQYYAEFVP
jgi:hypothetical protein